MIDANRKHESVPPDDLGSHDRQTDGEDEERQGLTPERLRAKRLSRSLEVRRGNEAFSIRATAKHLQLGLTTVRLMLRGERGLSERHVPKLPPTLREEVLHGRPSERLAVAPAVDVRRPK